MKNRSVMLLFGVVVLSTALAATEVISTSGGLLLVVLMAVGLIAVQREKVCMARSAILLEQCIYRG